MMCLGLDPGLSGAVALVNTDDMSVKVWDVPTQKVKKKRKLVASDYLDIIEGIWQNVRKLDRIYVEEVGAMGQGEGRGSMFNFGQVFGAQVMGLHAFGYEPTFVRPSVWKLAMGCGADKDSSLIQCLDLFGDTHRGLWFGRNMGTLDGRCEAALIALYGSKQDG